MGRTLHRRRHSVTIIWSVITMGDMGDMYREWTAHKKEKKTLNAEQSITYLINHGVRFETFTASHLRVEENYDFWPSTGLFIHRVTKQRGRGVRNLIKLLEVK